MNLITLILAIAIAFGLTDFLTERYPRLQRDIFYIAWCTIAFLFAIKYYYGPDIASYVPFYENVPSVSQIIAHPDDLDFSFEPGYAVFCRVLKDLGISFYWMTAILSILYFVVILVFFRKIDRKRSFALAILVVLDFNVVCYELRQCLAVILFLLMVLCLDRKRYIFAMLMALAAIVSHKSGVVAVIPTLAFYLIGRHASLKTLSQLLLVLLVVLFLLPITKLSFGFIDSMPLPDNVIESIHHHLSLGRQVQMIFFVYAVALVCLVHYSLYCRTKMEIIAVVAIIGLVCIATLYQYYYLLNRIRSYFTPIILVFLFRFVQEAENKQVSIPYGALIKQTASMVIMLYMMHATVALHRGGQVLKNKVNDTCTVFDLIHHRASDVQNAQMKKATLFWEQDYMQHENNKLK